MITAIAIGHTVRRMALMVWRSASFLAISRFRCLAFSFIAGPPRHTRQLVPISFPRLTYAPAVVDGRKLASNEAGWSAAPWLLPPMPASPLRKNAANAPHNATIAAATNTDAVLHFTVSNK